jgi:hypothetical protein
VERKKKQQVEDRENIFSSNMQKQKKKNGIEREKEASKGFWMLLIKDFRLHVYSMFALDNK